MTEGMYGITIDRLDSIISAIDNQASLLSQSGLSPMAQALRQAERLVREARDKALALNHDKQRERAHG